MVAKLGRIWMGRFCGWRRLEAVGVVRMMMRMVEVAAAAEPHSLFSCNRSN